MSHRMTKPINCVRTAKTLIRLGRCPGWSESLLGTRYFVGFVMMWLIFKELSPSSVGLWLIVHFIYDSLVAICWERAVTLVFHLCYFNFSDVLVVRVPFPIGVWGRMWNSIVLVPDHCLFIYSLSFSIPWRPHMKFGFISLAVSKEKKPEKCWIWVTLDQGQEMTLTFDIHKGSHTHLVDCI